jgi:hypothetical protein
MPESPHTTGRVAAAMRGPVLRLVVVAATFAGGLGCAVVETAGIFHP